MKITIATVCYNSEYTIAKTIESVLQQTYTDIEYIVVDGSSSDGTIDMVKSYQKDNEFVLISEPDKGLYDAMNKAARIATGEYILYMNSGDIFADEYVVEKILPHMNENNDIVYGNVIRCKKDREVFEKYHGPFIEMRLLLSGKMMCHQSMFCRTEIIKKQGFNLEYTITADYDFVARMLHDKRKFKYVKDITVSKVESEEGISSLVKNMDIMREQDDRSLKTNFPVLYAVVTPVKEFVRFFRRIDEKRKK